MITYKKYDETIAQQ